MFEKFRFSLHKTIFLNYNRYLRKLIDHRLSGRCSEERFAQSSERYFEILQNHYQKAFDLSRKIHGVPDENLHRAWESVQQHFERYRYRKGAEDVACPQAKPGEMVLKVANEFYQRSEGEIRSFVEGAVKECRDARGELNGQGLFLKLLDSYVRDEFLRLARRLGGQESPHPRDLWKAQLQALDQCHQDNPGCFGSEGKFQHFRGLVEQNLDADKFYKENLEKYREAARRVSR